MSVTRSASRFTDASTGLLTRPVSNRVFAYPFNTAGWLLDIQGFAIHHIIFAIGHLQVQGRIDLPANRVTV